MSRRLATAWHAVLPLDIIVDGRSVGQLLYNNDGTRTFSFAGASVPPAGSGFVYETDCADLDNDLDTDGFYLSMNSFNEGTARSNLIGSGSLTFTGTSLKDGVATPISGDLTYSGGGIWRFALSPGPVNGVSWAPT